jgi:hypothetical protein
VANQALNYSQEFVDYLAQLHKEQVKLKVALRYTPDTPMEFAQNEANIHARIDLLSELIRANINPNVILPEI